MVSPQTGNLEMSTSDNYFFRKTVYIRIKGKRHTNKDLTKRDNSYTLHYFATISRRVVSETDSLYKCCTF